jgi:hypothetical protein
MSRTKMMVGSCFAMVLALLAWGCAGKAGPAAPFDTVSGQHPTNWLQVHYAEYIKNPDQCRSCHGSTSDPAQAGGIAKVSCFNCHTAVNHPANWADHMQHGRNGAELAPVVTTDPAVPVMAGLAHCTKCHGDDYLGGVTGISCKACHTKAPHPDKPWLSTSAALSSHTMTAYQNAPACYKCHANGANFTGTLVNPAPPSTAPGCFNSTMCHGNTFASPT